MFAEYTRVRVVKLNKDHRPFSGSEKISRTPKIGDEGIIVHIMENGKEYVVENVDADGHTVWLADFVTDELESA